MFYLNYLSRLEPSSSFDVTGVNVALAMAGLTFRVNELLDHPGTTFMRRALRAPLDVLTDDAARNLLLRTAALTPLRFRIPYFPEFVASSEGNLWTIS